MRALIVAAHPDDEVLGCGGVAQRMETSVLILTDGVRGRYPGKRAQDVYPEIERRRQHARAACAVLGATLRPFRHFEDQRLIVTPELVREIEAEIDAVKPDVIFSHWSEDLNADHVAASLATRVAARPFAGHPVKWLLEYEVDALPTRPFDGTVHVGLHLAEVSTKLNALRCYDTEIPSSNHPRSNAAIEARMTWYGARIGESFAEAFSLVWGVWTGAPLFPPRPAVERGDGVTG